RGHQRQARRRRNHPPAAGEQGPARARGRGGDGLPLPAERRGRAGRRQRAQPAQAAARGEKDMSGIPQLFAVAAVLAAILGMISIASPRRLALKVAALATMALFLPLTYASLVA